MLRHVFLSQRHQRASGMLASGGAAALLHTCYAACRMHPEGDVMQMMGVLPELCVSYMPGELAGPCVCI